MLHWLKMMLLLTGAILAILSLLAAGTPSYAPLILSALFFGGVGIILLLVFKE